MRAFLYDTLTHDEALIGAMGPDGDVPAEVSILDRVFPRESQFDFNIKKPFLIYGLGNDTNEDLAEDDDHVAHRQFFEVWIHDEGGDYGLIDDMVEMVKAALRNRSDPSSNVTLIRWLETSAEFANETYNTIFRYVRFQAIISKGEAA